MTSHLVRAAWAALLIALATASASADMGAATTAYEKLLVRYVTPRGVKYDAWRSSGTDVKTISEVVMLYRSTDPRRSSRTSGRRSTSTFTTRRSWRPCFS